MILKRYKKLKNDFRITSLGLFLLILTITIFSLSFSSQSIFAWTAPSANPAALNADQVINTGPNKQVKLGYFIVNGNFSTSNFFANSSTKNVGIGTILPNVLLDIFSNTSGPIVSLRGTTTNFRGIKIKDLSNSNKWLYGASSSDFVIGTSSLNNLTINSQGKIGFGFPITSTSSILTTRGDVDISGVYKINGATTTTDQWATSTDGQYYLAGHVSMGTTSVALDTKLLVSATSSEGLRLISDDLASPLVINDSGGNVNWEIGADGSLIHGDVPWARIVGSLLSEEIDPTIHPYYNDNALSWWDDSAKSSSIFDDGDSVGFGEYANDGFKLTVGGSLMASGTVISKGTTWKLATSSAIGSWRVAYGNNLFVAVDGDGGNFAMTSPDGINWTSRSITVGNFWTSIVYGNGLFVAVADNGISNGVMTSPDGVHWTARNSASDRTWQSVTYGGGLFVAVASGGASNGQVMTSPNGITWTSRNSVINNNWTSVTYGANGLFVAVANSGAGNRVMTSPDGFVWTSRVSANNNNWTSVNYANGLFVAVANSGAGNRVMTSPDGFVWTLRNSAADNNWTSVGYGSGIFVAVANSGSGNRVITSNDGIIWKARNSAANYSWQSISYGNGRFVVTAKDSVLVNKVMYSGVVESNIPPSDNIYQGGMNIFGYLGLGTKNPNSSLHIYQDLGASAEIDIQSVSGTDKHWAIYNGRNTNNLVFWNKTISTAANILSLQETGGVSIGTTTAPTQLSFYDAISGPIVSLSGLSTNFRGLKFADLNNNEKWFAGVNDSNGLIISKNGGAAELFISSSTGIGTSAPVQKLDVAGNIKTSKTMSGDYCDKYGSNCKQYNNIGANTFVCNDRSSNDTGADNLEELSCNTGETMVNGSCEWNLDGLSGEQILSHPVNNGWHCSRVGALGGSLLKIHVQCCMIQ